ncbi:MAG: hypothetical protein NTZ78_14830 [Candidatus Aureabacteria bacterium]|nr:hypothetical protein [Candidatus Auribacterota bacterium]
MQAFRVSLMVSQKMPGESFVFRRGIVDRESTVLKGKGGAMNAARVIVVALAGMLVSGSAGAVVYTVEDGTSYFWNGHSGGRALTRDANGRLWCAYLNYQTLGLGQIRVAYSDDNGSHWTANWLTGPNGPLYNAWPPQGTQENPVLVVDGEGLTHIIWSSYTSTTDTGGVHHALHWPGPWDSNWFLQREVADYAVDPLYGGSTPAAALDSQGRIHVVWSQKVGDASTKKNVYYAIYSGGKNGSWSDPQRLKPANDRDQLSPSIAIDPSDNVFVAYYRVLDDVGEIKLLSGANLGTIGSVSDSAYSQKSPCLACDLDGNLHIVWRGDSDGSGLSYNLYYRRRGADGQWYDVEQVNNATSSYHSSPSIATDMNGKVYIISEAYMASENDFGVVRYSKFINDSSWNDAHALAMMGGNWATKETRMLHAVWPMVNGLPLNIPKAMYAYYFDVYQLDPISGVVSDNGVRAGSPSELTWAGQNYAEFRIVPPTTGGFTYAAGEQINLEWRVYPETFTALKTSHNIYFGAWKDPSVDGRSGTIAEVGSGGRISLYLSAQNKWVPVASGHYAWKNVAFPLEGNANSGSFHFTIPQGAQGRWTFVMAIIDPITGSFIASPEVACSQYFWIE